MSETFAFIKECGPFFISTINGDAPATRPFGGMMEYQGSLYVATSNKKDVYAQLKANPKVQIVSLKAAEKAWSGSTEKRRRFSIWTKSGHAGRLSAAAEKFPHKRYPDAGAVQDRRDDLLPLFRWRNAPVGLIPLMKRPSEKKLSRCGCRISR